MPHSTLKGKKKPSTITVLASTTSSQVSVQLKNCPGSQCVTSMLDEVTSFADRVLGKIETLSSDHSVPKLT